MSSVSAEQPGTAKQTVFGSRGASAPKMTASGAVAAICAAHPSCSPRKGDGPAPSPDAPPPPNPASSGAEGADGDRHATGGLHGVADHDAATGADPRGSGGDGLADARLVVGCLQGQHHPSAGDTAEFGVELSEVEHAVRADREKTDAVAREAVPP